MLNPIHFNLPVLRAIWDARRDDSNAVVSYSNARSIAAAVRKEIRRSPAPQRTARDIENTLVFASHDAKKDARTTRSLSSIEAQIPKLVEERLTVVDEPETPRPLDLGELATDEYVELLTGDSLIALTDTTTTRDYGSMPDSVRAMVDTWADEYERPSDGERSLGFTSLDTVTLSEENGRLAGYMVTMDDGPSSVFLFFNHHGELIDSIDE